MGIRTSFLGARGDIALFLPFVGDDDDNLIVGSAGDDTIEGLGGDDILRGGAGNDLLDGGDGLDTADYTDAASGVVVRLFAGLTLNDGDGGSDILIDIENVTGSAFNDTLLGSAGANVLSGGAGRDYLIGLGGNDVLYGGSGDPNQLQGGTGDDDYYVDANDTIVEFAGEGHDRVFTTQARLVLAANVEDLAFVGAGAFTGIGNDGDNTITGGAGDDTLSGRGGDDVLDGGDGVDTASYSLASGGVSAFLDGTDSDDGEGGTDTLTSIENLLGSAFDDLLYGSAGNNVLDGADGDDILVGRGGNDTLRGGAGFDLVDYSDATSGVYVKLNIGWASDGEGGIDTLISVEDVNGSLHNDVLVGSGEDNFLYGLDGSDYLVGLDGDDLLSGGAGAPNQLQGGLGDDLYYVDANDTLIEFEDEGYDTVVTTLNSYTLRAHFEELVFYGVGDFIGTGNDLDNVIYGGAGDDILTGGRGDDVLVGYSGCGCGGSGFDTVVLAGVFADYLIEDLGGGIWGVTDTVADRDGFDLLVDIAQLRFSDGSLFALVPADDAPALAAAKSTDGAQVLPGEVGDVSFSGKDADMPRILSGQTDDDFILGKTADLPLVLPGGDGEFAGLLTVDGTLPIGAGFQTHMLTLHREGGFTGGTDDGGRPHDHDGWLF
jgi:Ca2+-binding RTX toxin-like protein